MKKIILFLSVAPLWGFAYETPATRQVAQLKPQRPAFNALVNQHTFTQADRDLAANAWKTISAWQADGKADTRKLHVVYVSLRERPPLADYKGRLDRTVKNIQAFYSDQMAANGYPPLTFALDLDANGNTVVHDAFLDAALADYTKPAFGDPTRRAADAALRKAGIDPDRDYTLIVCQIPDGLGPYYGSGSSVNGRCWTCDAAHIDPLNLAPETPGPYRFKTLGYDNTVYLGGTAHELGHCFSLPHTMTPPGSRDGAASIMGNGNYHYGSEKRGGKGACLLPSDALRLAAIPLFSGKEKTVENPAPATFAALAAEPVKDGLAITGRVAGNPPVYGIVAYFDPAGGNDYDASSTLALPEADGSFAMTVTRPRHTGLFTLRFVLLQVDGTFATHAFTLDKTPAGIDPAPIQEALVFADVARFWKAGNRKAGLAALAQINAAPRSAAIWKNGFNPPWNGSAGLDPATCPPEQKSLSLAEAKATRVTSGWGPAYRDTINPHAGVSHPFPLISGHAVSRFLYTHTPGSFTFNLGGAWTTFTGLLASPAQADASFIMSVIADGRELLKTDPLKPGAAQPFTLDVTGASTLEIRSAAIGDKISNALAILADPVLTR